MWVVTQFLIFTRDRLAFGAQSTSTPAGGDFGGGGFLSGLGSAARNTSSGNPFAAASSAPTPGTSFRDSLFLT